MSQINKLNMEDKYEKKKNIDDDDDENEKCQGMKKEFFMSRNFPRKSST